MNCKGLQELKKKIICGDCCDNLLTGLPLGDPDYFNQ